MSSKHSPPISTHSASETTKAPGDSPRRRCLTAATRFTAASSASTSSTRRRLSNSSPEIASPACPVSVGSSARKMIRPGPLSPLAAFTPRVSSLHRSWSLLPPAMITSTTDGKALRMRGFLVLRALPQQSAQRPPATTSRTATHRSRSDRSAGKLLRGLGFRLHANVKTREGADHPDRDAQFRHLNETVRCALAVGEPMISVDAKKRELVGDFKAVGREWEPSGRPVEVRCHDFKDKDLGHAIPYGVYDIDANEGMVSVGVSNDTSAFAVSSIRAWWQHLGRERYPNAGTLTITADGGGSNSSRTRLWKIELQKLADEIGLSIRVCHFPPGTSKWNKIEHRMFSYVSLNWRGKPLESLQVIIDLIGSTTTSTGLKVYARLDPGRYEKGTKVTDRELAAVNIERDGFHPDWNYTIHPTPQTH